jgi:hypothetical protein
LFYEIFKSKILEKKYKKYDFMKWLRKTRNKISKETHDMTIDELKEYYRKGSEEYRKRAEEVKEQNTYFKIIVDDYLIKSVIVIFTNKFNSFQWVWDHQEEVYNATRGKNRGELIDYFESIYQYIQEN